MQVWSLALLGGLRIQHCCSSGAGHNCSTGLIPGPGTSTCYGCGQKQTNKQKSITEQTHQLQWKRREMWVVRWSQVQWNNKEFGDLFKKNFFSHSWHAEIPGPGIKPGPQQWPEPLQWQHWVLNPLCQKGTPIRSFQFSRSHQLTFFCDWHSGTAVRPMGWPGWMCLARRWGASLMIHTVLLWLLFTVPRQLVYPPPLQHQQGRHWVTGLVGTPRREWQGIQETCG